MKTEEYVRKGTTTVGIVCKGGVVMAADKRATVGGHIVVDKKVDKVMKLTDNIAITVAGSVSDIQLLVKLITAELNLKKIRTGKDSSVKEVAHLLAMMVYNSIRRFSAIMSITGFLLSGVDKSGFHLYSIGVDGSISNPDDYAADGSGLMMAWGVLDTLYKKDIPVSDGVKLAVKAINAAMQRDAASGEGIDVITVTKDGVNKVFAKKLETHIRA